MTDFKTLLAGARLPEIVVHLCLRGDLVAEVAMLTAELKRIQGQPSDSLAGNGAAEVIDRIEGLQQEMREHTYPVRLRALSRPAWRDLCEAHPPRLDDDGDMLPADRMAGGVNQETIREPLIRLSMVDPELTDAEWRDLDSKITDSQFEDLAKAAWNLNQGKVDIPFSRADLQQIRDSVGE